jgi:2-polyprenyl-3-methyl-5-hydroxy-6-metoxy-1,4-benzoquinol methylase
MNFPDYNTYQKLYGRFLKKGPEPFFVQSNPNGKRVLDLCTGGGELSTYALEHGAEFVLLIDLAPEMINPHFKGLGKTNRLINTSVEEFLLSNYNQHDNPFDIVTCRQSINYWFKNVTGESIAKAVKKGGMFIFNTFNTEPLDKPMEKVYYLNGKEYREVSFLFKGKVHHVQCCEGMEPHFTVFDWIEKREYVAKLFPYFHLEQVMDGPSSMWYCTKK